MAVFENMIQSFVVPKYECPIQHRIMTDLLHVIRHKRLFVIDFGVFHIFCGSDTGIDLCVELVVRYIQHIVCTTQIDRLAIKGRFVWWYIYDDITHVTHVTVLNKFSVFELFISECSFCA